MTKSNTWQERYAEWCVYMTGFRPEEEGFCGLHGVEDFIEQELERAKKEAYEECIQELLNDNTPINASSKYDLGWRDGHNAAIDQLAIKIQLNQN